MSAPDNQRVGKKQQEARHTTTCMGMRGCAALATLANGCSWSLGPDARGYRTVLWYVDGRVYMLVAVERQDV
jgi:hypothetical protein